MQDNHYYRVVCFSGDVFYTRAKSASEFILDRIFVQFMVLCVLIFTSLMIAIGLPAIPQFILFGASIVSTFFWLAIVISLYQLFAEKIGCRTFYTPLLLFPMQVMNTLLADYILRMFETTYIEGFDGLLEVALRTFIIIFCLDVLFGKFVAAKHGLTVTLDDDGNVVLPGEAETRFPDASGHARLSAPVTHTNGMRRENAGASDRAAQVADAVHLSVAGVADEESATRSADRGAATQSPKSEVSIGKEKYNPQEIQFIKSEDHYLVLQMTAHSEMVRGRLKEVSAKIDAQWGLQINRSIWVAYAALSEVIETSKGQVNVVLTDGSTFKVASSRKIFFEHGCAQYAPSLVWRRDPVSDT